VLISVLLGGSCCQGAGGASSDTRQNLSEMDFERGIWQAAIDGEKERAENLLAKSKGAAAVARDASGYTALHYAARAGHATIVRLATYPTYSCHS